MEEIKVYGFSLTTFGWSFLENASNELLLKIYDEFKGDISVVQRCSLKELEALVNNDKDFSDIYIRIM